MPSTCSSGAGLQWIAAPETIITVRADPAFAEGGTHAVYVGIGHSF